jgi:PKD repeat protein
MTSSQLIDLATDSAVQFTDTSTNSPTAWLWEISGIGSYTEQNPLIQLDLGDVGNHTVTLTAINSAGSNSVTAEDYLQVIHSGFDCDPFWSDVAFALHLIGDVAEDLKGNSVTAIGDAAPTDLNQHFSSNSLSLRCDLPDWGCTPGSQFRQQHLTLLPEAAILGGADFSVSVWVYPVDKSYGSAGFANILSNRGDAGGYGPLQFSLSWNSFTWGDAYWQCSVVNTSYIRSISPITFNEWVYLEVCYNHATSTLYFFVDGDLQDTLSISIAAQSLPWIIGAEKQVSVGEYFVGDIQDVRVTVGVCRYETSHVVPTKLLGDFQCAE